MKTLLTKMAFVVVVVLLMFVLVIPIYVLREIFFAGVSSTGGHYRMGNGLLPSIIIIYASLFAANRVASRAFMRLGLADRRWSIFARRGLG